MIPAAVLTDAGITLYCSRQLHILNGHVTQTEKIKYSLTNYSIFSEK